MPIRIDDEFPRAYAETGAFRNGLPRNFEVTDDHITFLRADGDTRLGLWRLDVGTGVERPLVLAETLTSDDADLPAAERARRERLRESGSGITAFSMSADGQRITFAAGGTLWLWSESGLRSFATPGSVVDPRIDVSGSRVACVIDGAVHVFDVADGTSLARVARDGMTVGLVDFIAAEELNRYRGHWWAPDGTALLVEVVDESHVPEWYIADPTFPQRPPMPHRYPHAGATNPAVSLLLHTIDTDQQIEITWDHTAFEYLVAVHWSDGGTPLVQLANREQTRFETFAIEPRTGELTSLETITGSPWLDVVPGTPARLPDGHILSFFDDHGNDCRRITIDGQPATPPGFHVISVISAGERPVIHGSFDSRTATALRIEADGTVTELADGFAWHTFASNGNVSVRVRHAADSTELDFQVLRDRTVIAHIANRAECAAMPAPEYLHLGNAELNAVILWPEHPVDEPLPIIMSPYGGPHHSRVLASAGLYAVDQWLANQGFVVVVADGRGTPGRGLAWDHAIVGKFAQITLSDQVAALDAVIERYPDRVDGSRVGIRGWSYGGYLSALALLARPDRFHVGVAGAPVTDWRLYDTAYTERYLGHPDHAPQVYDENSLIGLAPNLRGRLLIVHGLADDNVVSAHALQLSAALLAAGRPHDFLPLAGVSHMTPQVAIKENLLKLEADYFRRHLGR